MFTREASAVRQAFLSGVVKWLAKPVCERHHRHNNSSVLRFTELSPARPGSSVSSALSHLFASASRNAMPITVSTVTI